MAHLEVNTFLNKFISTLEPFYKGSRVLEIGSYDVNGSVRSNFKNVNNYVGVDLIEGPSVDVVIKGHLYRSEDKFDVVLSVESFEHNSDWIETFKNMVNLVDDNGIVIFTCASKGRPEHGTFRTDPLSSPGTSSIDNSYYMNLDIADFLTIFDFDSVFTSYNFYVNKLTKDLYFYGLKGSRKIDVKVAEAGFRDAYKTSANIRKKTNFISYFKIRCFYLVLSPLYLFLTDRAYQNLTHAFYKKARNLRNL